MKFVLLLFPSLILPRGRSLSGEVNKTGMGHIACDIYLYVPVYIEHVFYSQ